MGDFEDDAVHKIPHKMKTHWQNKLKFSVLVRFTILKGALDMCNLVKHQYVRT